MVGLLNIEEEGSKIAQNFCTYVPNDVSCISQKKWIFSNAAVGTWNLTSPLLATIVQSWHKAGVIFFNTIF